MRPAQVLAAALAAITAAFLGSSLGVYGTVVGAGVVSLATTVGGEFYLRSLDRTKQAVKRAKEEPEAGRPARWPVLAGASVAAFALGMVAVTGIEAISGSSFSGEDGKTVTNVLGGGNPPAQAPADLQEPVDDQTSTKPPPATTTPPPSGEPPTSTTTEPAEPPESTTPSEPPAPSTEPEPTQEPAPTPTRPLTS